MSECKARTEVLLGRRAPRSWSVHIPSKVNSAAPARNTYLFLCPISLPGWRKRPFRTKWPLVCESKRIQTTHDRDSDSTEKLLAKKWRFRNRAHPANRTEEHLGNKLTVSLTIQNSWSQRLNTPKTDTRGGGKGPKISPTGIQLLHNVCQKGARLVLFSKVQRHPHRR